VDLTWLFPWVLFAHVLGAIIAFGPTFSLAIVGAMGGAEPQHANFATRASARVSERIITPLAIFQGITGVLLIVVSGRDVMASRWLLVSIVLYLTAIFYALVIQKKHVSRVIELTSTPPPPDAAGPPPELMTEVAAVRRGGMILGTLIVVIVFLMVVKPF
jgi:uncharacterized membrane protein